MQRFRNVEEEKRLVENLCTLVGARKLIGVRLKYKPPGEIGRVFVKVLGVSPATGRFELQAVESGAKYNDVPAGDLSIGTGSRREGDPLIELLRSNGMQDEPFMQRSGHRSREEEGRGLRTEGQTEARAGDREETPAERRGAGARVEEGGMGFRTPLGFVREDWERAYEEPARRTPPLFQDDRVRTPG